MPSGFKIVQSTLSKIDGFKSNIDNVESLIKAFNILFVEFSRKISGYFWQETFLFFKN